MKKIFKNAVIVTQNSKREIFNNGMLIVNEDVIEYVGPTKDIDTKCEVIDLKGNIIIPGFINNHTHLQASTLKGSIEGLNLEQYLMYNEVVRKNQSVNTKMLYKQISIEVGIIESLKSGITTVCSSNCRDIADKYRIRVYTGPLIMDVARLQEDYRKVKNNKVDVINKKDFVYPIIFVHSLYRINLDILANIKKSLEQTRNCLFMIHIAETKEEIEYIYKLTGKYPVELLDSFGLITESTLLVHCTYIQKFEAKIIAERGAKIIVCPISNVKLGEEIPNIPMFIEMGIKISIGTDGLATNGSFDMLLNARITFFLVMQKYGYRIKAQSLFDMISIDAADVLGNKKIGGLEKGKYADFQVWKANDLCLHPQVNIIDNIVFSCNCKMIQDLYVGGKSVINNNEDDLKLEKIIQEYNSVSLDLRNKIEKERCKE